MSVENQTVILPEELKAAIACLDLSLESELALYRNRQNPETMALAALPNAELEVVALQSSDLALETLRRENLSEESSSEVLAGALSDFDDRSATATEADQETAAVIETEDEIETLPESYSAALTAEPKAFDQFLDPSIEDYLESSEALLKHLDDPAAPDLTPVQESETPKKRSWVVTSGITLLVLGLLALAGFLGILAVRWFSVKPVSVPTPQPLVPPATSSSLSPLPSAAIAPTEGVPPNLAPNPAANTAVTPTPSTTPTAPINPNAARYLVLATAADPETLQAAQRLVPEAYITEVEGQERVQLAALDSLEQAQQIVNDLKNQGFPAFIVAQN
jgi:cell division septation protein DedD